MKIKNFSLVNVFVQVNTYKGFGYLDNIGNLINNFIDIFPKPSIGQDSGLRLVAEEGKFRELAINVDRVWFAFSDPDTITFVKNHAQKALDKIFEITQLKKAKRFGLRFQLAGDLKEKEEVFQELSKILKKVYGASSLIKKGTLKGGAIILEFTEGTRNVLLRVNVSEKSGETSDERYTLLYDFDFYEHHDKPIEIEKIRAFFNRAEKFVKNDTKKYLELSD